MLRVPNMNACLGLDLKSSILRCRYTAFSTCVLSNVGGRLTIQYLLSSRPLSLRGQEMLTQRFPSAFMLSIIAQPPLWNISSDDTAESHTASCRRCMRWGVLSPSSKALHDDSSIMKKTLLLCFIHGFKGDDNTFGTFPSHLAALVRHGLPKVDVQAIVYPKFETRGNLESCVSRFRDWFVPPSGYEA